MANNNDEMRQFMEDKFIVMTKSTTQQFGNTNAAFEVILEKVIAKSK